MKVVGSRGAFVALLRAGFIYAWEAQDQIAGWKQFAINDLSLRCGDDVIVDVVSTDKAFALLTVEGRVLTIGSLAFGGGIPSEFVQVLFTLHDSSLAG